MLIFSIPPGRPIQRFGSGRGPRGAARYTFVFTAPVVVLLGAEGREPVKASKQRVRLEDRIGFQMHEIRFARRLDLEGAEPVPDRGLALNCTPAMVAANRQSIAYFAFST